MKVGRVEENAGQHRAVVSAVTFFIPNILNLFPESLARQDFVKVLVLQIADRWQHFARRYAAVTADDRMGLAGKAGNYLRLVLYCIQRDVPEQAMEVAQQMR